MIMGKYNNQEPIRWISVSETDEFIILLKDCNEHILQRVVKNIRDELDLFNEAESRQYKLSLSLGYTLYEYGKDNSDSFFKKMDDNMYEEKKLKHSKR